MRTIILLSATLFCAEAHAAAVRLIGISLQNEYAKTTTMALPAIDVVIEGESVAYTPRIKGRIEVKPDVGKLQPNVAFDSKAAMRAYAMDYGCRPASWGPANRYFVAYMTGELNRQDRHAAGTGEDTIRIKLSSLPELPRVLSINLLYTVDGEEQSDFNLYCPF